MSTFAPPPGGVSSDRRRYGPSLSMNAGLAHSPGQNPPSATSLSGPFIGPGVSTFASPSASATRASNVPYDPLQWAAGHSTGTMNRVLTVTGDALPSLSPPPPYSPRGPGTAQEISPASDPSRVSPIGAVQVTNAPENGVANRPPGPTTTSPIYQQRQGHVSGEVHHQYPPPPSAPSDRRTRSSSRPANERAQPLFSLAALTSRVRSSSHAAPKDHSDGPSGGRPAPQRSSPVHMQQRAATMYTSSQVIISESGVYNPDPESRPPASRRAASTGAIGNSGAAARPRVQRRSPTQTAWEPGMPLPPPPPGPPPNARSQSLNRSSQTSSRGPPYSGPQGTLPTRRPPAVGSSLPPVPPTPADWVDDSQPHNEVPAVSGQGRGAVQSPSDLYRIPSDAHETTSPAMSNNMSEEFTSPMSDPSGPHSRPKGIRERRSESRTGKQRLGGARHASIEPSNNPWAQEMNQDGPVKPVNLVLSPGSTGLTRRPAMSKSAPRSPRTLDSTDGRPSSAASIDSMLLGSPGYGAHPKPASGSAFALRSPRMSVPTPPFSPVVGKQSDSIVLKSPSTPRRPAMAALDTQSSDVTRPVSHILHTPNTDPVMPPLSPSQSFSPSSDDDKSAEQFSREAQERYQAFVRKEAMASTDADRVKAFADFIVYESRIRRDRYADTLEAMGSDLAELTKDLFQPLPKSQLTSPVSPGVDRSSHRGSLNSVVQSSFNTPTESPDARPESTWWTGYMPSLSPIPSMSVTEIPDEMNSRGRPPSRWWESSQTGSIYGGGSRGLERSKRESKYMGLPLRELDEAPSSSQAVAASSSQTIEYPPEKVGWHEQVTPRSSDPRKLDVSRLVTVPPPYPRHYPAVNNNHPDLALVRTVVRGLSELEEVTETKRDFITRVEQEEAEAQGRRTNCLNEVRQMLERGKISYPEAVTIESAERAKEQAATKAKFDRYQEEVLKPLHALLSERITKASASFEQLRSQLGEHNPIEEGDEKPELLEKLTLLKWLFEAREQLHREIYDLSNGRNEMYKDVVLAPYNGDEENDKIEEVNAFFQRDGMERRLKFERDALKRFEQFMDLVEETVKKGVEVQLSTFWDIAPPLVEVMQKVQVESGVQADGEYSFSQQYLWEVLCHAEQSAYQFIDGQIDLLCLLHEIKVGMTKQTAKAMEAERMVMGEGCEDMAEILGDEEKVLTADLQEKVKTVEKQWGESMGQVVDRLKERVREWLQRHGGWEGCEDG